MKPFGRSGWNGILLAGVAAERVLFLVWTRHDPVFNVPYLDSAFYHTWARSLAEGRGDFRGAYFLGPLYPYFVACLYRVFGAEPMAVRVAQAAFGVVNVGLVLHLGWRIFGPTAGRAAALLLALYGPLLFYENLLVLDVLQTTLALVALWLAVVPVRRPRFQAALVGALVGAAALARPTALCLLPVAAWAAWRRAGERRRVAAALCVAGCTLVILPVVLRNQRLGGGVSITTNGGVNFYAGNGPHANGRYHEPEGVAFFRSPRVESAANGRDLPSAVAARALTVEAVAGTDEAARSGIWLQRSRLWMRAHPGEALFLPFRKMWLVLQAREIPQIESYEFQARRLGFLRAAFVDFGWLWPLAALGIWRAGRALREALGIVAAWAAALLVPSVIFFVSSRHRLIAVPEVAVLAGAGAATLIDLARRRDVRGIAVSLAAIAPLAVVSRLDAKPPRGASGWEHAQMAERLYAAGDLAGAIAEQQRAAAELPDRLEAQLNLALYWSERGGEGDTQQAERLLREIVGRWPREPLAFYNLGVVLATSGRQSEAVAAWRTALVLDPHFEPARRRLAELRDGSLP